MSDSQPHSGVSPLFRAAAAPQSVCKCCGAQSRLYGVVDFNRNCAGARLPNGVSGIPIYYYRCPACQFLFTTAFDQFTQSDFLRWVYNAEYELVDPEYARDRPSWNANEIDKLLVPAKSIRILDYGAGSGLCASILRQKGFADVHAFDPFVPELAKKPEGKFSCIFCSEVIEHSVNPRAMLSEMTSMLMEPDGIIMLTTLLQPHDFERIGLSWWYVGPRNGHVSLLSANALDTLLSPLGLLRHSFNDSTHLLARQVPWYARSWFTRS